MIDLRTLRVLFLLGMTCSLAAILAGDTSRAANHFTCVYLPWVPNSVEIYDPVTEETSGPYHGQIIVQNLENEEISVVVLPYDDCHTANPGGYYTHGVGPHGISNIPASLLSGPSTITGGTGGGIVIGARMQNDPDKQARFAVIQRQVSPAQVLLPASTNSSHVTTSGYAPLDSDMIGPEAFLPIAQTNTNWNTRIHVSNFDPDFGTQVDLTLYPAGGGAALGPYTLPLFQGETETWDLRDLGVPDGWIGSAMITSSPDRKIGAVAERIKVETNMLLMNTSRADNGLAGDNGHAALIFRDWNFWNTGVSVGNFTDDPNDVTITFYDLDGDEVFSDSTTIPPKGMDFFYLPAGAGEPFVGSASIEGTHRLYGAVDEVKYFGDDPDTGHAMSYMLHQTQEAREGHALAFPLYSRGNPETSGGDTSGIQVVNRNDSPAEVEFIVYDQDGVPALDAPDTFVLGARESKTLYAHDYTELPEGFVGSAIVRNKFPGLPGESGIIGVMNLVNYDVQYDGSATYNHTWFSEMQICGGLC